MIDKKEILKTIYKNEMFNSLFKQITNEQEKSLINSTIENMIGEICNNMSAAVTEIKKNPSVIKAEDLSNAVITVDSNKPPEKSNG